MAHRILKTCLAAALVGVMAATFTGPAAAAELVLGTGGVESAYFDIGNKLVRAIALDVDSVGVNIQATKGDKDNLKLLGKKKRGVDLGLVRLDAAKAAWNAEGKKQNRKVRGLFSLGAGKDGKTVVLLASQKVSNADARAIVAYLLGKKGMTRMKKLHGGWGPQAGSAAFKAAGIPMHAGAAILLYPLAHRVGLDHHRKLRTYRKGGQMAATTKKYDLILRGGRVIDPAANRDGKFDVGVRNGKIAAVSKTGLKGAKRVIDVTGALVLPGMIDTHAHVYQHVTGRFGLNPDLCGVHSGVTTVVDQGGPSAMTIPGFRKFIVEPSASRVVCFISTYLVGGMEGHLYPALHGPDQIDVKATVRAALANRDIVKGIKTHAEVGGASRWGIEVLRLAKKISRGAGIPIYVHLGQLWPATKGAAVDADEVVREIVPLLDPGDVLAHPFTRHPGGFISEKTGEVHPVVWKALERGVHVDVGHGSHFSFKIARMALEQGIVPFTLGADLHGYNVTMPDEKSPVTGGWANPFEHVAPFSLCHAMTELLTLGMSLGDVIKTVTSNAAIMAGMADEIGTLKRGRAADVSVVDLVPGRWELRDNSKETVIAGEAFVPRFTVRAGERYEPDSPLLPQPVAAAA